MPETMIRELIPQIGKRYCFIEKRKHLLAKKKDSFSEICTVYVSASEERPSNLPSGSEVEITASIASCSNELMSNSGQTLQKLLSESSYGKKILTQIRLTSSDRNKITHLIIDKLLAKSNKVSSEDFQKWAEEIVSLFKHETISTYFVPSNAKQKRLAHGKLWDKYNNLKKCIKKHEIVKENSPPNPDDETLLTLRSLQPDDPDLLQLWKETYNARKRGTSITKYYDEYPVLKSSIAVSLIRIDYGIITGIDPHIFLKRWPKISPYIIQIAEKNKCARHCVN